VNAFLIAHGYDPGPTQRPALAGCFSGLLATVPAVPVLALFGSLAAEAGILGLSPIVTIAVGTAAMAAAGVVYGRLFRRAANDCHGGWLFGMAYGFLLWAGGAVLVLPALSGGQAPAGVAAVGIFVSLLLWGTALGASFPFVHRTLHARTGPLLAEAERTVGPLAAAASSSLPRRPMALPDRPSSDRGNLRVPLSSNEGN
jgi:hypothetical protein